MKKIILIGGGGHAEVVAETIRAGGVFVLSGVIDRDLPRNLPCCEVVVVGDDDDLPRLREVCPHAFVSVGSLGSSLVRERLAARLHELGFVMPALVHPSAVVAHSVQIGEGVLIAAGAVVQPGAVIGRHAIINTRASIDHDCRIGAFAHVAPGVVMSGGVIVEDGAHIGTGSSVIGGVTIGARAVVGVGSAVVRDIPPRSVAYGNPCRVRRERAT